MTFDIFIPVGPNDFGIIDYSLKNNKKKIDSFNDVYLFSEYKNFNVKGAENIDENFFPFSKNEVIERVENKSRAGWIYQQLVGLYYPYLQKNSEYVLVLDSDVFFTKKIKFFNRGKGIFTVGKENHEPYFEHMRQLHPKIVKVDEYSGISHHMLYKKEVLISMFEMIENLHEKEFYKIYIEKLNPNESSPSADYEIYYNYALNFYSRYYDIRKLSWTNLEKLSFNCLIDYDMVSLPHWKMTRPDNLIQNIKEYNFKRSLNCVNNYLFLNSIF
tara:strand:- start:943 stop:1758 length:816 start_codon:yes stop_codon:yes gene_type:complete